MRSFSAHYMPRPSNRQNVQRDEHCYLCGATLSSPTNTDHVPLRGLIAPAITQKHNLDRVLTIRVHKRCNSAYTRDEEYFLASLIPFSRGSEAGDAIYAKYMADYKRNSRKAQLIRRVLSVIAHGVGLGGLRAGSGYESRYG